MSPADSPDEIDALEVEVAALRADLDRLQHDLPRARGGPFERGLRLGVKVGLATLVVLGLGLMVVLANFRMPGG